MSEQTINNEQTESKSLEEIIESGEGPIAEAIRAAYFAGRADATAQMGNRIRANVAAMPAQRYRHVVGAALWDAVAGTGIDFAEPRPFTDGSEQRSWTFEF